MRLFFKMPSKLASGKIHAGVSYKYMLLHLLIYVGASKRKRERWSQTGFSGWMDKRGRDIRGPSQHSVTSLSNRIRSTDERYWVGQRDFCARRSMLPQDRVYRDRSPKDPRAIHNAFTAGQSRSPTDNDKFMDIILIATPRTRSGQSDLSGRDKFF